MVEPRISVLVLYENFAIGAAVLRRLLDLPMVHLVRAENTSACEGPYDVVVMCPYLRENRRAEVLRRWASRELPTSVIELSDVGGAAGIRMLTGRADSPPARAVLSALAAA